MAQTLDHLEILSTRNGFNAAVRHIKSTISLIEDLAAKENLGNLLVRNEGNDTLPGERIALLLRMLLVDKMGYRTVSANLGAAVDNPVALAEEFRKWKAVDLVAAYHHPDLGLVVANPKDAEQLAAFGSLRKRELLVVYAGKFEKNADPLCDKAAEVALSLFEGAKAKVPETLYAGEFAYKAVKKVGAPAKAAAKTKPARKAAAPKKGAPAAQAAIPQAASARAPLPAPAPAARGPSRMTPMVSVVVQNELFHNGNVEAWKRIIDSYKTKYPGLEVYIYYEGERIININSLFKWGKVKHGSTIQFAVAGSDIKDVAKLSRYLMQGASHQFEAFLHGPVSTVLKLF
jgi:hypothetical protein